MNSLSNDDSQAGQTEEPKASPQLLLMAQRGLEPESIYLYPALRAHLPTLAQKRQRSQNSLDGMQITQCSRKRGEEQAKSDSTPSGPSIQQIPVDPRCACKSIHSHRSATCYNIQATGHFLFLACMALSIYFGSYGVISLHA